ncbi:Transcriptional regulator, HxlR family [Natrarchaeobaculum sulfurireducens]|uniref:Transcriptional regulator, HxlR family n=2 Tax=Natrarchaeobaculum sulfurireducens TaxID=2044521 RepID=A0A346PPE9_9EURY|nr:Transcriptional regulator, HxlR family [Natrarchaeobaculum sulfurireducens]
MLAGSIPNFYPGGTPRFYYPMSSQEPNVEPPNACPVIESLEQIGSQWRLAVLHELLTGEQRFNELKRSTGANARTLSRVLDDLGETGFVERRIEEDAPIATYYSLTEKGESLEPVFDEIDCWASSWLDGEFERE